MSKQLHHALVSALINDADDTAADEPREEHTPRAGDVVYTHDELHSAEEPKKIIDVVFFGVVKGW